MYCPNCHVANPCNSLRCTECSQTLAHVRERLYIGTQFIFVRADDWHPVALLVDGELRTFNAPAILSRHCHAIAFGDEPWDSRLARLQAPETEAWRAGKRKDFWSIPELPPLPELTGPRLQLQAIISDRKIYSPGDQPALFIVAPGAARQEAGLEIGLSGQKVYEARVKLNDQGLALHTYAGVREGEYSAVVTLEPVGGVPASCECSFSAAEFTLSPLLVTLERYTYEPGDRSLTFALRVNLLSQPYDGPVELRLHCPVCAASARPPGVPQLRDLMARAFEAEKPAPALAGRATGGAVEGRFKLCHHEGPFHIETVTPDGNTASVAVPNLGRTERERLPVSRLGLGADLALAPWAGAEPARGCYLGPAGADATPVTLEGCLGETGVLRAEAPLQSVQVVTFDPFNGDARHVMQTALASGATICFEVAPPYTLFTVAAFADGKPFEGWGVVIRPDALRATLAAPAVAAPGDAIDVDLALEGEGAYCWLLAYDARLEHESLLLKLGKCLYNSIRSAQRSLRVGSAPDAEHWFPEVSGLLRGLPMEDLTVPDWLRSTAPETGLPKQVEVQLAEPELLVSPARMEFPELVHNELLWVEGSAARNIRLGQQIGTWRVRAYLLRGVDCVELTSDVQAEKAVYAEVDLPALAAEGDEVTASVTYQAGSGASLVVDTPYGRTEAEVTGGGRQSFTIRGPGRVEVMLSGREGADWSVREVARPGVQRVTASRLVILNQNETVRAERAVVYAAIAHVLKDTITALIGYPFG